MFKCSGCGECCKHIDVAVKNTQNIKGLEFPYKWDETGRCENLMEDNKCKVYDQRPLLCNVDEIAKFFNIKNIDEFYNSNYKACEELNK